MNKHQIQTDAIQALKQGNKEVASLLRMTVSVINTKEKEKRYTLAKEDASKSEEVLAKESELTSDEFIGVITSEIKKRKDAIALYQQGGRQELADSEQKEIEVLQVYLPAQLSDEEVKKLVEEAVSKVGAKEMKDMGKVMAELMPHIKGKADTGQVSNMIKALLNK